MTRVQARWRRDLLGANGITPPGRLLDPRARFDVTVPCAWPAGLVEQGIRTC